jgi:DNA-binding protein YbaB
MEDLCAAATNQALAKARQLHAEAMQSLTADFDMPQLTDAISKMVGNSDEES